jgi:multiple sugar transport system substrate-binding protein
MEKNYMSTNKLSRRDFLKWSATATAATVVAGCTTPSPTAAPKPGATQAPVATQAPAAKPVSIDFLAWGDQTDLPAWEKLIKDFREKNSNFTINETHVPGADHYTKLQTMIAGGTPPDIASFQGWEWQVFAEKNLLAPLDDYIAKDKFTTPYPAGIKAVEDTTAFRGKKYLVPLQFATMLMLYARKPFQEANIPFPTDNWTFEEFLDISKKLTKTTGDKKIWGFQSQNNYVRDIHWIRGTGKQEYDTLVYPKKAMFNQKEIIDIAQLVNNDVFNTLKISPTPADYASGANTINTGNCALKYEGAWFFTQLNTPDLRAQNKQVEFDVVMMPKQQDPDRPHRGWAEGVSVVKTAKSDDAWKFSFYMGGTGNKTYSEITGRLPNDLALIESWWVPMVAEKFQVKNGKAFIEAFKRSEVDVVGAITRTKITNEVVKPVAWDVLAAGKATAAEVMPKVDQGVQKLLDEYWATVK